MFLVSLVALWTTFSDARVSSPFTVRTSPVAYRWGNVRRKKPPKVPRRSILIPPKKVSKCGNGKLEYGEQCDDGNRLNDDGCSELCILVAQPIRHGALRIEQQGLGNIREVVGGKGILLLAFEAVAGRQDVYLTTLKFRSAAGTLSVGENYRLLGDINGDRRVDTLMGSASAQGESLTFANVNILVENGRLHRLEVWGDLRSDASGTSVALEFSTSEPDVIEGVDRRDGEDVSGVELNTADCTLQSICWVRLFTAPARTVTVTGTGSLQIER